MLHASASLALPCSVRRHHGLSQAQAAVAGWDLGMSKHLERKSGEPLLQAFGKEAILKRASTQADAIQVFAFTEMLGDPRKYLR